MTSVNIGSMPEQSEGRAEPGSEISYEAIQGPADWLCRIYVTSGVRYRNGNMSDSESVN